MERRSPTGIARERETRTNDAGPANLTWSAGLRPASRGSAKPAPTTLAPPISRGAPVSDRHRAGARNPHQRRWPANLTWSAGLRPASRGSAKPAPTTLAPPISRGAPVSDRHRAGARNPHQRRWPRQHLTWSAGLRPASRGSAKPAPTTLAPPISRGAPVSDRHRRESGYRGGYDVVKRYVPAPGTTVPGRQGQVDFAEFRHRRGARNPHQRRCACWWFWANPTWSAGLRPASRGSAKPAPTTLAPPISRGAPVSDRHRAGARTTNDHAGDAGSTGR